MYRTHTCGCLRACNVNETVTLAGWVQKVRNLGAMTFIDLRDRYGLTQITVEEHSAAEVREAASRVGREWVLRVTGARRRARGEEPQDAHGRHRSGRRADRGAQRGADPALHHRRAVGRRRRPAHEIPLPRPAPPAPAAQHDPAAQDGAGDPPLPRQRGIPRDRNPLSDQIHARRGRATSSCRAA